MGKLNHHPFSQTPFILDFTSSSSKERAELIRLEPWCRRQLLLQTLPAATLLSIALWMGSQHSPSQGPLPP